MLRQELHSESIATEQMPPVFDPAAYDGDIVMIEKMSAKEYADELAFNEDAVTIRIEPTAEKNGANVFPIWVTGRGAEVYQNGRWEEVTYLPAGQVLTTKRKYLEVMIRSKTDTLHTKIIDADSEMPRNMVDRFTSGTMAFSVLEDRNPKGAAWMTELRRRNM